MAVHEVDTRRIQKVLGRLDVWLKICLIPFSGNFGMFSSRFWWVLAGGRAQWEEDFYNNASNKGGVWLWVSRMEPRVVNCWINSLLDFSTTVIPIVSCPGPFISVDRKKSFGIIEQGIYSKKHLKGEIWCQSWRSRRTVSLSAWRQRGAWEMNTRSYWRVRVRKHWDREDVRDRGIRNCVYFFLCWYIHHSVPLPSKVSQMALLPM